MTMIAPERRGANRHRHTTAPARNTSSKAPKTPHYCWYSVRVARPVGRNTLSQVKIAEEPAIHGGKSTGNEFV